MNNFTIPTATASPCSHCPYPNPVSIACARNLQCPSSLLKQISVTGQRIPLSTFLTNLNTSIWTDAVIRQNGDMSQQALNKSLCKYQTSTSQSHPRRVFFLFSPQGGGGIAFRQAYPNFQGVVSTGSQSHVSKNRTFQAANSFGTLGAKLFLVKDKPFVYVNSHWEFLEMKRSKRSSSPNGFFSINM